MNPWKHLGIEPTREEKDIKRAYTRMLKQRPPETDPSGFQELRTAYESALFFSRLPPGTMIQVPPDAEFDGSELIPPSPENFDALPEAPSEPEPTHTPARPPVAPANPTGGFPPAAINTEPAWQKDAKALLDRIAKDFPDHVKRQYDYYWSGVLDAPVLWNLDAKSWVGWNLFAYIGEQNLKWSRQPTEVHLSKEAWLVLDETFGWLESEAALHSTFPEDLTDSVLDPIRSARGLMTAADLKGPPAHRLIAQQENANNHDWLRYMAIPIIWLIIHLFRNCSL